MEKRIYNAIMLPGILSLILGIVPLFTVVPIAVSIIGLALGVTGVIIGKHKEYKEVTTIISTLGISFNLIRVILFILRTYGITK